MSKENEPNDVDDFITKLHNETKGIHPNAQQIRVRYGHGSSEYDYIAQGLADAINAYEKFKSKENYFECKKWINFAYTYHLVIDGPNTDKEMKKMALEIFELKQKMKLKELEYDELLTSNQTTADDNIAWQSKLEQLKEDYDKLLKTLTQEGSIRSD